MNRYDWEWSRPAAPGGGRYDRSYGGGWWRGYGRSQRGGYGPRRGGGRYDRYGNAYDGWRGEWQPEADSGYRFAYGSRRSGRLFGRQEPWEPGPPSGYGSQWGAAYGDRGGRYDRYDRHERFRPDPGPYERGGAFDPFGGEPFADLPDAPRGYYDGYDPEADDEAGASPWRSTGWGADEPDDSQVRESVARSLRNDGFIDAQAIQVEVKDRVVTLRGEVKDYMEARYAWDDAWDAPGVRGVISKLTVASGGTGQG